MAKYNPANWYWIVAGSEIEVWSSATAGFVPITDAKYSSWVDQGNTPTRIVSLQELRDVLAAVYPAGMLETYAAAKRFEIETAGITVAGTLVDTSRDSQSMITNALSYVTAASASSVKYKAASGWVTLSADTIKAMALAVGAHVQACFEKEAMIASGIANGTIKTRAAIDAAFTNPNS